MVNYYQNNRSRVNRRRKSYRSPLVYGASQTQGDFVLSKSVLKIIIFAGVLGASVYLVLFSSAFAVKDVIVEGNNLLLSEDVANAVPRGSNIFRLHNSKMKSGLLARFPEISDLEIYRGIPNAIKIVIQERDARLLWQTGEKKYIIDSQGEITREVVAGDEAKIGLPPLVMDQKNIFVQPGSKLLSPNFVSFVTNIHSQFYDVTNIKPGTLEVEETTFDVILRTEAGFFVKFNTMRSSRKQLDNLKKVLLEKRDEVHEYVDLRIDGWAYYK